VSTLSPESATPVRAGEVDQSAISMLVPGFLLLFLLAAIPIVSSKIPPLGNYVNHLGRMHVIAVDGHDPMLARFYDVRWSLIPNLAMDLFVPPLAKIVGVYWAGKIFVLSAFALILIGAQAIHWSLFRRASLGPLVAVLFVYSEITSLGHLNYLFGIGVALCGTASWIGLRGFSPGLRFSVSLCVVLALFLCHLSALGLYGVAVAAFELWHCFAQRPDRRMLPIDLAVFGVPFLIVPFLLAAGPTGGATLGGSEWQLYSKAEGLWYVAKTYYRLYDLFTGAVIAACALWVCHRRWIRLHPAGWFVLVVAVPLYLALPFKAMSAFHVDDRLPLGVVLLLCGFLAWDLADLARQRRFLVAIVALALLRLAGVEAAANRVRAAVTAFDQSLELVKPGSKIMVAQSGGDIPVFDTLEAVPCLAIIERSSLVSIAFSHPAEQVLMVKTPYRDVSAYNEDPPGIEDLRDPPQWSAYTQSSRIYWRHWAQDYDYLYVISASDASNPLPDRLTLLYQGPYFQLYRIRSGS